MAKLKFLDLGLFKLQNAFYLVKISYSSQKIQVGQFHAHYIMLPAGAELKVKCDQMGLLEVSVSSGQTMNK